VAIPVNVGKAVPAAYRALGVLAREVTANAEAVGLEPLLIELVKVRTSQLNGCAFCLRLHTADAVKAGESGDRLAVLPAWRETDYFSDRERAGLALCEAVTLVAVERVCDHVYDDAADVLTEEQVAAVVWLSTTMNAFNRLAILSRHRVAPPVQ
jgi:AhpD family alkylhydroperoxidase